MEISQNFVAFSEYMNFKSYRTRNNLPRFIVLVNPTELEIFYQDLLVKALLLGNHTELEIFYQDVRQKSYFW